MAPGQTGSPGGQTHETAAWPRTALRLGKLVGAVEFRRNHGEIGRALHVESRIVGLHVVNELQARFAVIQARAHRFGGCDCRIRAGVADAGLVQSGEETAVVTVWLLKGSAGFPWVDRPEPLN